MRPFDFICLTLKDLDVNRMILSSLHTGGECVFCGEDTEILRQVHLYRRNSRSPVVRWMDISGHCLIGYCKDNEIDPKGQKEAICQGCLVTVSSLGNPLRYTIPEGYEQRIKNLQRKEVKSGYTLSQ